MKKLKLTTREIGTVSVFDIEGFPTEESLSELVSKIQKKIRRHRIQRVILNLQDLDDIDPIAMRKLLAACIRPQRSLIYGASSTALRTLQDSYLPQNVRLCQTEEEVADDFGPFLLERGEDKIIHAELGHENRDSIGYQVERRRSKRMHVAIPVELLFRRGNGEEVVTRAIMTNISEGGMFAEFLDNRQAAKIAGLSVTEGMPVDIKIFKSTNFPEDYQVRGVVMRQEIRKKQLGLAVKFVS